MIGDLYEAISGGAFSAAFIIKKFAPMVSDALKSGVFIDNGLAPGAICEKETYFGRFFSGYIFTQAYQYTYAENVWNQHHHYKPSV